MINTKKLEQEIEELKNKIEHTPSKTERTYLNINLLRLNDLLYSVKEQDSEITMPIKDIFFLEKQGYNIRKETDTYLVDTKYMEFIRKLCKTSLKKLKSINTKYYFNPKMNLKDAKDIIRDFINSYDPSLLPIVEKCLSNECLFILYDKEKDGDGYTYYNPYHNTPYITIYLKDENLSTLNLICILHEIGHGIHFYKTNTRPKLYNKVINNTLVESPAMTLTVLFINYLIKNKIHEKDSSKLFNNELEYLKQVLECLKISNLLIKDIAFKNMIDLTDIESSLLDKGLEVDGIKDCIEMYPLNYEYSLGGLLSFYFLDKYRSDPEQTKRNFDSFINSIGTQDDFYMFTHFGISMNEFMNCEYLKKAVEENNKRLGQFKI